MQKRHAHWSPAVQPTHSGFTHSARMLIGFITLLLTCGTLAAQGSTYPAGRVVKLGKGAAASLNRFLYAIDLTSPTAPSIQGRIELPHRITALTTSGTMLMTGMDSRGVAMVDARNPASMGITGTLDVSGRVRGLSMTPAGILVIAAAELACFDFTTSQPARVGAIALPAGEVALGAKQGYLLTPGPSGASARGLTWADPSRPGFAAQPLQLDWDLLAFDGQTTHAAIAGAQGVVVFDVARPTAPGLIAQNPGMGEYRALAMRDGTVFAASEKHLEVYELDGQELRGVAREPLSNQPVALCLHGQLVLLLDVSGMLHVFSWPSAQGSAPTLQLLSRVPLGDTSREAMAETMNDDALRARINQLKRDLTLKPPRAARP